MSTKTYCDACQKGLEPKEWLEEPMFYSEGKKFHVFLRSSGSGFNLCRDCIKKIVSEG